MSTEEIQDLFLNQGTHYEINLEDSKLQGEAFITYIANMQMNCSLPLEVKVSSEKKLEVMKYFFNFRQTIKCQTLLDTAAFVMLKFKGINFDLNSCWLNEAELDLFIKDNLETIGKTALFLESSLLFVPSFNSNFKQFILEPAIEAGEVVEISDIDFIGVNILGLFTIPSFIEFFLSYPPVGEQPVVYFKEQVEKLYYDKKPLFEIICEQKGDSFLMSLVNVIFSQETAEVELFKKYIAQE